ncbi:LxmA leader domain family RiPP, partial [Actinoplanes philippinensis]
MSNNTENTEIVDLVAQYETYAEANELNLSAASDAPATSPVCAVSAA